MRLFVKKMNAIKTVCVLSAMALLSACSGGSGSDNMVNTDPGLTAGPSGFIYNGPPAATDDVQQFQVNFWSRALPTNRCGQCHDVGGIGTGSFVRRDDVNLAYNVTVNPSNPLVDLGNPGASLIVTRVANGHNCWLADDQACADILTGWIRDWANNSGSEANVITLTAPPFNPVTDVRSFPDTPAEFQTEIYDPILVPFCSRCHSEGATVPQQPFFASTDIDVAYDAAQSKIDLADVDRVAQNQPTRSRFIIRLREDSHNCWTASCANDAVTMQNAIIAFAGGIQPTMVDDALFTSGAVTLGGNGILASTGGRIENDVIALYTFKAPDSDDIGQPISEVFDVSGIGDPVNLRAFGSDVTWVGNNGVRFGSGRLQGGASKLHELITLTGEYSIEAWVVPANVVQDDVTRIVAYSGGAVTGNNFVMGQSQYNYDFLARSTQTNDDGEPAYSTPDDDEVLQASLQHVVLTYDPVNGRRIFVNGENVVSTPDDVLGGTLANWDDSFALALGQNAGGGDQWQGTIRLLAIHNRALSQADIQTNFDVGVGERFFLLFDLTNAGLVSMPRAYIAFEVEQFDTFSYLFKNPFFISLDGSAMPGSIDLQGMRIGVNGRESIQGQAYAKVNTTITNANYNPATGLTLSSFGTLIPLENGPDNDQFFLTFDRIETNVFNRVIEPVAPPPTAAQVPDLGEQSLIGVRHFDEVNRTLSQATGIPITNTAAANTFAQVRQQLPQAAALDGFLPANQTGVTQLAVTYCSQLAQNTEGNRASFFPGFNFSANPNTVFGADGSAARGQIINPLLEAVVAHTIDGDGQVATSPAPGDTAPGVTEIPQDVVDELNDLIDRLVAGSATTEEIVTGVCGAVMGSALMMLQ